MAIPRKQVRFAKPLPHPGVVLAMDYIGAMGIDALCARTAHACGASADRTPDTAPRLSRVFANLVEPPGGAWPFRGGSQPQMRSTRSKPLKRLL